MGFLIGLLTVVMVLVCLVLVFLVLLQLPKKEAGAGLAFGGGATDALFGAGAGNVLTKITKYAATCFFVLAIVLSVMQSAYHNRDATNFATQLQQPGKSAPAALPPASTPPAQAPKPLLPPGTNAFQITPPVGTDTNVQITGPTNPPTPTPEAPK